MVDLSKAKVGDTVVFRCGGRAVIRRIVGGIEGVYYFTLEFDVAEPVSYTKDGEHSKYTVLDITEVIPAPVAFDWNKVKHGEAFMRAGSLLWFMGKTLSGYLAFDSVGGLETISYEYANSHLTRAHEHDIKEVV